MASMTFTIDGEVQVEITVTETGDGSLQFDLQVVESGTIGDLQGIFFDLADDSLTSGLIVSGTDVSDEMFKIDAVSNLGQGVNVNGEVINELGKFDAGVQIGTQGISGDDIQSTTFILSHDDTALSLADIASQDFAVRLTSVGEEGGTRDGSLKLAGSSDPVPNDNPDPDVDPDPEVDTDPNPDTDTEGGDNPLDPTSETEGDGPLPDPTTESENDTPLPDPTTETEGTDPLPDPTTESEGSDTFVFVPTDQPVDPIDPLLDNTSESEFDLTETDMTEPVDPASTDVAPLTETSDEFLF